MAAAIAAIPEEPPILLAVILGFGAYRLLRRDVLVRRLNAQETLGAIDLIVTDKTGTLTTNHLSVARVRTPGEELRGAIKMSLCARRYGPRREPGTTSRSVARGRVCTGHSRVTGRE